MKLMRILAALLAMLLVCGSCLADEVSGLQAMIDDMIEDAQNSNSDNEYVQYTADLLPELDMTLDDWLDSSYMRAIFSVLLMLETANVEEFDVNGMVDEYGMPSVYIAGPAEGDYGSPIYAFYFFGDTDSGTLMSIIYSTSTGDYTGMLSEVTAKPSAYLDIFVSEGVCGEYYEISDYEFSSAISDLNEIINGD